ncbi:MAG: response regulator [Magnetococcales bacterium]|nr:response regulator [Magnetococcales bacterium]
MMDDSSPKPSPIPRSPHDLQLERCGDPTIRVFLIDDQSLTDHVLRRMLRDEELFKLHYCGEPLKAIEQAVEFRPSVILLDLFMPDLDGITLLVRMRNHEMLQQVPIVVLSVEEDPKVKASAFASGANDYLIKLPARDEMIARLRYHGVSYYNLCRTRALETERQQMLDTLEEALASAEFANRAKSNFLAAMSHDIRTPMNAILGMCELLLESRIDQEQTRQLTTLHNAGEMLLLIINDILDLSRIEEGRLALEPEPFDLRACLEETVEILSGQAQEKGIVLRHELPLEMPSWLLGDERRLRQVLINLIGNAIKFTERGEVVVRLEREGDKYWLCTVRDTGIGIPASRCNEIFSPFTQADRSITRRYGGAGLGLSICHKLLEMMKGRIWVESREGEGSLFSFTAELPESDAPVPMVESGVEEALISSDIDPASVRILMADDSPDNVMLIRAYLSKQPWQLEIAINGAEAVELVKSSDPYHLVLMDIQMPVMDGYTATIRIRQWEETRGLPRVPIIALTANAMAEDRAHSLDVGCDVHISKPVRKAALMEVIQQIIGGS